MQDDERSEKVCGKFNDDFFSQSEFISLPSECNTWSRKSKLTILTELYFFLPSWVQENLEAWYTISVKPNDNTNIHNSHVV